MEILIKQPHNLWHKFIFNKVTLKYSNLRGSKLSVNLQRCENVCEGVKISSQWRCENLQSVTVTLCSCENL